ncbi:type II toxin-antitoxin system RelE/ParE family toxin, partial [Klebsiella pneumoniae]|uniref:type II toxin-antitoxin system RelE/ParE family toxin n=1 Tax=Klebsiella pneumoniae TaxID=573 RepID=UPI0034D4A7F5|nr:hypothetical protein [Klebsiella pneumoniae]
MLAYLNAIATIDEIKVPPNFGAHLLTGDRAGTWALTVTKNWRMTFRVTAVGAIEDLDLEDYHRWRSSCIPVSRCIPAPG